MDVQILDPCASWLGCPSRIIKEQMGYARAEDMYSRYVHVPRPDLIQAISRIPPLPPLLHHSSVDVHPAFMQNDAGSYSSDNEKTEGILGFAAVAQW
jgi:hypothetical protein